MATKKPLKIKANEAEPQQHVIDAYSRILQLVAVLGVIAIYVIMSVFKTDIPVWVPAGLLGVAIGLSPEQISKIITDVGKTFIGKK